MADATSARRLLDTIGSARLKIILDTANLANVDASNGDRKGLAEAIDLLAADILISMPRTGGRTVPCARLAKGLWNSCPFLGRLQHAGYDGPLVIHGIEEGEVPTAVSYLRSTLETLSTESSHALY